MGLVDYSSSAPSSPETPPVDGDTGAPPSKRRKGPQAQSLEDDNDGVGSFDMPPLPSSFHDLYASSVRQSAVDDPALHHGRKRQTPHVVGNWPTHLYVEWHPTKEQHQRLTELLQAVEGDIEDELKMNSLLTSDAGAPLPLHISLSRPLSLPSADRDSYLDKVTNAIRSTATQSFAVRPQALAWYRSPDSDRTFLILRVASTSTPNASIAPNPELLRLLTRSNEVAKRFKQLALYQRTPDDPVGVAFHVSVAWTFRLPNDEAASMRALHIFRQKRFRDLRGFEIGVEGVKVKIGNVVHHVPLGEQGADSATQSSKSLFD